MFAFPRLSGRKATGLAGVALFALLALAACGGSSSATTSPTATTAPANTATTAPTAVATTPAASGAASIGMSSFSFTNTSATIKAGQSVTFKSTGTHLLVIGKNGTFTAESGAPSELNSSSGTAFSPGDSTTIVFPNAGTFDITCMIHPSMQATVTVTP